MDTYSLCRKEKSKEKIINYAFGLEPDEAYAREMTEAYEDIVMARDHLYDALDKE